MTPPFDISVGGLTTGRWPEPGSGIGTTSVQGDDLYCWAKPHKIDMLPDRAR